MAMMDENFLIDVEVTKNNVVEFRGRTRNGGRTN